MAKDYAKGIKRKDYPGDLTKLKPGMLVDYFVQHHLAKRRGPHYDFRIGTKDLGLYSWATQQHPLKTHEGDKFSAARTNIHRHSYGKWEGMIPPGYGHGQVKSDTIGKALITRVTPKTVSFTVSDKKYPERYTLINPGEKYGKGFWMLLHQKTPEKTLAEKSHYKTLTESKVKEYLKNLPKGHVVQPKIDGALQFITFNKNKIEMLSHRLSEKNNKPIVHTERVFKERPHVDIPKELQNSILLAEVYGVKDNKPIAPQETSGILNSSIDKALKTQKDNDIRLNAMIFGIASLNGKPVKFDIPYSQRKELLLKALKVLPKNQFHLPEEATTSRDALRLWKQITSDKHSHTTEGLVVHPEQGIPTKIKVMPEQDVYIRDFFPGEGKYKDNAVGGFQYSHTKNGPIVGKVGTGINDTMRKLMHEDPKQFIGRIARVHSQGQLPSGALRAPALINIHEG